MQIIWGISEDCNVKCAGQRCAIKLNKNSAGAITLRKNTKNIRRGQLYGKNNHKQ